MSLPPKLLISKQQQNSFPCNNWFDNDCKHQKRIVNDQGKKLKGAPNNSELGNIETKRKHTNL